MRQRHVFRPCRLMNETISAATLAATWMAARLLSGLDCGCCIIFVVLATTAVDKFRKVAKQAKHGWQPRRHRRSRQQHILHRRAPRPQRGPQCRGSLAAHHRPRRRPAHSTARSWPSSCRSRVATSPSRWWILQRRTARRASRARARPPTHRPPLRCRRTTPARARVESSRRPRTATGIAPTRRP